MAATRLDSRKREILSLTVGAYIATGEPVPSSVVARKQGRRLSPATVRHEMSALEAAGFLHQPHTSAGRTPTAKAYEFYAQEMTARARLRPTDAEWIKRELDLEKQDPEALMARIPHVLAELCHGVGLVVVPPLGSTSLDQIRFVLLDDSRVLAVVISKNGLVRDKVVLTREHLCADELERMSVYLNDNFRGWTLSRIRVEMERRVSAERSRFLQRMLTLCSETFEPGDPNMELRLEGLAHLSQQDPASPEEWKELLQALEGKERLARLLSDCLESPEEPVKVMIGLQQLSPAIRNFALVGARYGGGADSYGSLGLLGRTRMDYARAVTAVAYVATLFDQFWAEN